MNEWIIVKDLERKKEREGRNQKYTRIFSFMRGRGNKRSDRFCSISQIFQYTRYTWRKFEFHLPEQETGRISGIKSSNWKRSIGGDIESWIFLPLSGNLAICHGISHVRGIGERRGGGRGKESRILELRTLRAGGVQVRSNLELDYLLRRPDPFALILGRVTELNLIISWRHYERSNVIRLFLIPVNWNARYPCFQLPIYFNKHFELLHVYSQWQRCI